VEGARIDAVKEKQNNSEAEQRDMKTIISPIHSNVLLFCFSVVLFSGAPHA